MSSEAPTGSTTVACVIGDPVHHSMSPAIHNAAFAALGLDWVYVACRVLPGSAEQAVGAMSALGLGGMSVTMPHKAAVIPALGALAPTAERLAAVNCIARDGPGREGGRLVGHNTDGEGFVRALVADGFDPSGSRCVVVGAGGAARSVTLAMAGAGASDVAVHARRESAAADTATLAGAVGRALAPSSLAEAVRGADLLVNATPLGMAPDDPLPVPRDCLGRAVVVDLVYHPAVTPLMEAARSAGSVVRNGIGMLVHQAAIAFEIWTEREAPLGAMLAAASTVGRHPKD